MDKRKHRNYSRFCLSCFSSYTYFRVKTDEIVCRKCGRVTSDETFKKAIANFKEETNIQ